MSVLGTISLSGLTTTNSDIVVTQNLEVTQNLTVDNGATITLPNNSIPDNGLSTNVPLENGNNYFTGTNSFTTSSVDGLPVNITFVGFPTNQTVTFCPKTSASGLNPYCEAGDAFIGADTNVVIGREDRYNALRLTDNQFNLLASDNIYLEVNAQMVAEFQEQSVNVYPQFISNASFPSGIVYENMFYGDIWTYKGLSSKYGLYIQDDITVGSTTYASINSTGDAQLASCLSEATAKDFFTYTSNNSLSSGSIQLCSNTNAASFNPLVQNEDCLLLSDGPTGSALTICRQTTNQTALRIDESNVTMTASGAVVVAGQALVSNVPNPTTGYANQFVNSVYAGSFTCPTANITTITTTTQLPTDSSTKPATTAWVVGQNFAFRTTSNTFTAPNTFRSTALNGVPFMVRSARITPNPQLSICVDTSAASFNPLVQAGDAIMYTNNCTGIVIGTNSGNASGFRCDGLTSTMYGKSILKFYISDKGTTPALELNATTNVSNSLFNCTVGLSVSGGPISPPNTSYATTSNHQGFQITPTITTPSGAGVNQLASVVFDNSSNYSFGTYLFEYHLVVTTSAVMAIYTTLATSPLGINTGNYNSTVVTSSLSSIPNTINQTAMIAIYSNTTYYLNFHIPSGTYTYTSGLFKITRVA
jgi:hypothetical protein